MTAEKAKQTQGLILVGIVTDVGTRITKQNKTMYTYYVSTARHVYPVRSMQNGLKRGDQFKSFVSDKVFVSKSGTPGLELWEGDRV